MIATSIGVCSTVGPIIDPTGESTVDSSRHPFKIQLPFQPAESTVSRSVWPIVGPTVDSLFLFSACGKTLYTGQEGSITSPNHPIDYPSSADCVYRIQLSAPTYVEFSFSPLFRLETSVDFIKVVSRIFI